MILEFCSTRQDWIDVVSGLHIGYDVDRSKLASQNQKDSVVFFRFFERSTSAGRTPTGCACK